MIILPSRNGMLLRNSNGIISSDCGGPVAFTCPCELLTGSNCSCFGNNTTPSTYIADFGEMGKFCLNYVSGCTWQKSVGTITVTLNLTYATNTTRLTVVDGSTTVFSGDLVETDCDDRKYGIISNTVSPSDWGSVFFTPSCSSNLCLDGRIVEISYQIEEGTVIQGLFDGPNNTCLPLNDIYCFGYMQGTPCLIQSEESFETVDVCEGGTTPVLSPFITVLYNNTTGLWQGYVTVGNNITVYNKTLTKYESEISIGESFELTNNLTTNIKNISTSCCSASYGNFGTGTSANIGVITITVY